MPFQALIDSYLTLVNAQVEMCEKAIRVLMPFQALITQIF